MNDMSRRNFLLTASSAAAGTLITPGLSYGEDAKVNSASGLQTGALIPLRYAKIPGFLSAEQLAPHYSAHYGGALRGYVAADNKLQSDIKNGDHLDPVAYGSVQRSRTAKGNSVILHELYFDGMALKPNNPGAIIRRAIEKRFATMDQWAVDFQNAALSASGWAVLAFEPLNGKLYTLISDKHDTGLLWMAKPLLVLDVYEHAYYLDYKNNKRDYIEAFMDHIDWRVVGQRYQLAVNAAATN